MLLCGLLINNSYCLLFMLYKISSIALFWCCIISNCTFWVVLRALSYLQCIVVRALSYLQYQALIHSILFYISWSGALIDRVLINLDVSFNLIVGFSKEFSVTAVLSLNWTVPCLWSHCWNCPDHGLSTCKRKMNEKKKKIACCKILYAFLEKYR